MIQKILNFLQLEAESPTLEYLQKIITSYTETVPWETVSRIIRKDKFKEPELCIKLETEFWNDAISFGYGGTCYESNLALHFLLKSLGFESYLTINQIEDKSSLHSANIVEIDSLKYIVDIGYPLYAPIPINENEQRIIIHNQMEYHSTYVSNNRFIIQNYPHPKPYLYHLTDKPVSSVDYLEICKNDYGDNGLFLDRIIIRKVKEGIPTRFDSDDRPFNIHQLKNGLKTKFDLEEDKAIEKLSEFYTIPKYFIEQAFRILANQQS